ncbi:MAG: hypothetical protein ABEH43_01030, partial [Flavobacteriales bacterium]
RRSAEEPHLTRWVSPEGYSRIEKRLGSQDSFYLKISGYILNASLNKIINVVNNTQNVIRHVQDKNDEYNLNLKKHIVLEDRLKALKSYVNKGKEIMNKFSSFHKDSKTSSRIKENYETLSSIQGDLGAVEERSTTPAKNQVDEEDQWKIGCFVVGIIIFIIILIANS